MVKYSDFSEEQKERSRAAHREWAKRNPRTTYYKEYDAKRYDSRLPQRMLNSARSRARANDLPFNITVEDVVIPSCCPICYNEMQSAKGVRGGSCNSPTLDRVHCENGYVKGNVAVICKNCNSKKGHATSKELRRIADWMDSF